MVLDIELHIHVYLTKIDSDGVITDKDTGKGKYQTIKQSLGNDNLGQVFFKAVQDLLAFKVPHDYVINHLKLL